MLKKCTNKKIRQMVDVPNGSAYKRITKSVNKVRPSLVCNCLVLLCILAAVRNNKY